MRLDTARVRTVVGLSIAVVLTQTGCPPKPPALFESKRFTKQHEAGSVHLVILAVVPWNEIVESMQPGFSLRGPDALKEVIASSAFLEDLRVLLRLRDGRS